MYYVPDGTTLAGFYECKECSNRFLSIQVGPSLVCPYCGEQPNMEIGPDELHDLDTNELLNDTTNERIALLRQAVSELDPDDQMLLSLYYQDEQSLREIGYIVDHPDAYLRSRLQWLRKKIHQTIINLEQNGNKHK